MKLITLSDILTSDGNKIHPLTLEGIPREETFHSNIKWPLWGKPSKQDLQLWKRELQRIFTPMNRDIVQEEFELGTWHRYPANWKSYTTRDNRWLYNYDNFSWFAHEKCSVSPRLHYFKSTFQAAHHQMDRSKLLPVTVKKFPTQIEMDTPPTIELVEEPNDTQSSFKPCLSHQVALHGKIEYLVQSLALGQVYCVSDGSFDPNTKLATAAWTFNLGTAKQSYKAW